MGNSDSCHLDESAEIEFENAIQKICNKKRNDISGHNSPCENNEPLMAKLNNICKILDEFKNAKVEAKKMPSKSTLENVVLRMVDFRFSLFELIGIAFNDFNTHNKNCFEMCKHSNDEIDEEYDMAKEKVLDNIMKYFNFQQHNVNVLKHKLKHGNASCKI